MSHNKIKYVITVSRFFPATHPRKSEPTGFVEKILAGEKIHTIRGNLEYWQKRLQKVGEGKAYISLRYWEGKPYNSKQVEFLQLHAEHMPAVQKLEPGFLRIPAHFLATNDGLSLPDFENWFKDYDLTKPMAIIQFSSFRY